MRRDTSIAVARPLREVNPLRDVTDWGRTWRFMDEVPLVCVRMDLDFCVMISPAVV